MKPTLFLILALLSVSVQATVNKCKSADGRIFYSASPCKPDQQQKEVKIVILNQKKILHEAINKRIPEVFSASKSKTPRPKALPLKLLLNQPTINQHSTFVLDGFTWEIGTAHAYSFIGFTSSNGSNHFSAGLHPIHDRYIAIEVTLTNITNKPLTNISRMVLLVDGVPFEYYKNQEYEQHAHHQIGYKHLTSPVEPGATAKTFYVFDVDNKGEFSFNIREKSGERGVIVPLNHIYEN